MKKYLITLLTLFILFGCAKKENPLTPNYENANKASSSNLPTISQITPSNYGQIQDKNGNVTGIQSEIVVIFSDFMDPATINNTNITLYNVVEGDTVGLTINYDEERRTAYITTSSFPNDAGFLFTIGNGVHNLAGSPLDGNGNGKDDGEPYDNALFAFYTGTGINISNNIRTSPPTINFTTPAASGNISVNTSITIRFNNGKTPMDTLDFTTQNFHLKENGTTSCTDSIESYGSNFVNIVLPGGDTLKRGTMYTFTIDAYQVLAEKDTLSKIGNTATEHLRRMDVDGDGVISADEDSLYTWKFITQNFPGEDSATPPQVIRYGDYGTYYLFGFSKTMDASTFTKENIKVSDNNGYVPGTFRVEMDSTGLKYYYDREISGSTYGWVSMEVKDKYGNKLDGNGNGIGGEAGIDDWSP